jgi:DNA (cytosine-5)-methyltransferase 1
MNNTVIDLFAGAGGFSNGFIKAGFEVPMAVEFDGKIAPTYKKNHPGTELLVDDIKNIIEKKIFKNVKADVVVGGPPCQGFSMAGARIRKKFIEDSRNYLFKSYCDALAQIKPKIFIFENVKGILTSEKGKVFEEIIKTFSDKEFFSGDSYSLYYDVFKATDFGIPQNRERIFIIGVLNKEVDIEQYLENSKKKIAKKYPDFFNLPTVWDAISNLKNEDESGRVLMLQYENDYQLFLKSKHSETCNHIKPKHSALVNGRMSKIQQGENWQVLSDNIKSVHSGAYGRLEKEGIAPTITTRFDTPSGGCFTHPLENRTLSPREGARLQSFPDDFEFIGKKTSIYKQIGNAVPPKMALFFAYMVNDILENEYEQCQ